MEWGQTKPDQPSQEWQKEVLECRRLREKCREAREAFREAQAELREAIATSQEIRDRKRLTGNK